MTKHHRLIYRPDCLSFVAETPASDPSNWRRDMLQLKLLGSLEVIDNGVPVDLPPSRKSRALLGMLAVSNTAMKRETLCELFWDVPDDPRASLRWSLSKLRSVVNTAETERLIADRVSVQFQPLGADSDIEKLRELDQDMDATADMLGEGLAMLEEDLLADCDLPSRPEFMAWLDRERQALGELKTRLQERLEGFAQPTAPSIGQDIRFLTAHDGPHIAWAEAGPRDGPTIVKAANWLSHLELDWQSPIWNPLFSNLAQDHHLIQYDERGCGMSDWDVPEISFDTFVADLEQVVDDSGADKFTLLGISQGAAVSIEYAARHPERVSKLVLFGGYPAGWRHTANADEVAEREAIMVLTKSGWGRSDPTYRRLFSQSFMPSATLEELDWFDEYQRQTTSPENAVRFLEAFAQIDVRHRLKDLQVPTLIVHSRGDRRIPHSTGRALATEIPGATLATLESDGHLLIGREPAAVEFATKVRGFIQGR